MIERDDAGRYRAASHRLGGLAPEARAGAPRLSPFHERLAALNQSFLWRDWSGTVSPTCYEPTAEREYTALRNTAGLIDVSPLYKVEFVGPDAEAATNRIFTRDVRKCRELQVMYTCWCDDEGKLLQDGNLVRLGPDHFRMTTADPSLAWFEDACAGFDVEVRDVTDDVAALALQGPQAARVLNAAIEGAGIEELRFFRGCAARLGDAEILVTRTGFTGDLGYEIWLPADAAIESWDLLVEAGRPYGALPAGLQALDQTRIEAGLVLIEVDFVNAAHAVLDGRRSSPYEAGLGWTVKLVPGNDFIGRPALEAEAARGSAWALVGVEVSWLELEVAYATKGLRPTVVGEEPDRSPHPVYRGRDQVGQVTSQFFSPLLKRHIGLATVRADASAVGTALELDLLVDTVKVRVEARVASLPFFDPERKRRTPVEEAQP